MKTVLKATLAALVLDLASKVLVQEYLLNPIDLGFLTIDIHKNTVLAWGIPLGGWWPILLAGLALGIVFGLVWRAQDKLKGLEKVGFGMILGGGIGNFVERVTIGGVTDFIDLGWFPAFNIADIAITIGAALIIASWIWNYDHRTRECCD